jgi:DNA repair photolyase
MELPLQPVHGRGASTNPANRFELIHHEPDPDCIGLDAPRMDTKLFRDRSRSIITSNDSPDIGFEFSINPYRGCEHGCAYCYARPYHEYLGFSAGLDFETRIMVKEDAPELLRKELSSPRWQSRALSFSGVTDAYQPIERRLRLTRRCLEVLVEFRNPVSIITKNHLVTRDLDLLRELAQFNAAAVFVSMTTLDVELARLLEPRATQPLGRLAAIAELAGAGIPVGVMTAPVIPGLNDHEIVDILREAGQAGARFAGHTVLRLPGAVGGLFENWLTQHYPARKEKVLGRLRELHGGHVNDPRFHTRMRGEGILAGQIHTLFDLGCRKAGLNLTSLELSTAAFRRPGGTQRLLFDEPES